MTIRRIGRIIAAEPNWSSPVSVEHQFKTNVMTSRDGTEQREAMRQTARVSLTYAAVLDRATLRRHMADLAEGQHLPFIVPNECRRVTLAAPAPATSATLTPDQMPYWLVAGTHLVVSDESVAEAVKVQGVAGGVVTLVSPLTSTFAAGAAVCHAFVGRVADNAAFRSLTDRTRTASIRIEVDPASDPQPLLAAAPAMFEGRELFLTRPNWRDEPSVTFNQERDIVDSGVGPTEISTPQRDHTYVLKLGFTKTGDDVDALVSTFLRMRGRRNSFWMPTWQQDIEPAVPAAAGTSTVEVEGSDFLAAYETSTVYKVLAVSWRDGTFQVNRIASMALNASLNTVLTMADPWAAAVDDAATVMWCPVWRFASDVLEVDWRTTRVAEMTMAMQTVANEAD